MSMRIQQDKKEWVALVTPRPGRAGFYITILDKETKSITHPSYPFPAESGEWKLAKEKAIRMVKRANSMTTEMDIRDWLIIE